MPAATYATEFCPFSLLKSVRKVLLLCLFVCVNGIWSTWVVRVGAPQKIFKLHFQISRLGIWTICFPIYTKYYLLDYFSRKFYDDVVIIFF